MEQIGARLREARMGAKIDINQVESDTKIRAKYLRAMENEEWSLLPGEIYAKTFLRTYADYLGIDSRELLDDYRRQYERPTDHDLRPLASGRERDRRQGGGRRQRGGRYQPPQPRGGGGLPAGQRPSHTRGRLERYTLGEPEFSSLSSRQHSVWSGSPGRRRHCCLGCRRLWDGHRKKDLLG